MMTIANVPMPSSADECQESWLECTRSRQKRVDKVIKENPDATVDELAKAANVARRTILRSPAYKQKTVTPVTPTACNKQLDETGQIDQRALLGSKHWTEIARAKKEQRRADQEQHYTELKEAVEELVQSDEFQETKETANEADDAYMAHLAEQRAQVTDWSNPLQPILSEAEYEGKEVWWRRPGILEAVPTNAAEAQTRYDALGWHKSVIENKTHPFTLQEGQTLLDAQRFFKTKGEWNAWLQREIKTCPATTATANYALQSVAYQDHKPITPELMEEIRNHPYSYAMHLKDAEEVLTRWTHRFPDLAPLIQSAREQLAQQRQAHRDGRPEAVAAE
jgi:hypothetical protein